ncbi:MAG: thermonuclease family protein [Candidatus Omnitrophica bacterium]|nr:thermonuclease family protein [Candidatus Omnitrophota bacterium]
MRRYRVLAMLIVSVLFLFINQLHSQPLKNVNKPSEEFKWSMPFGRTFDYTDIVVERVVDGDTLKLASGERVRLIGIDTPEMHESAKLDRDADRSKTDKSAIKKMGIEAYKFTKNLVEGKRISLEFDVEKYDKYDRLLAYVYLKEDGTFVNAEIVKQGYASLLTIPPNVKYADTFRKLYQEARENKRGLWR